MTPVERRALLAYARWWFGDDYTPRMTAWTAEVSRGWQVVAEIVDNERGRVAESLAYDGTDGP